MIEQIKDAPNQKLMAVQALQQTDKPIIMYGAGSYAVDVTRFLAKYGVTIASYCVDEAYVTPGALFMDAHPIQGLEAVLAQYPEALIIIGFNDYKKARKSLADKGVSNTSYFIDAPNHLEFFDYEYILAHQDAFEASYNLLADDLSREIFVAFINAKISGDPSGLYGYANFNQYFSEPVELSDEEVFVDCGAYDGDSIKDFLENTHGAYKKIFAFEPDEENYQKLLQYLNVAGISNVKAVQAGCWSEKTTLSFASEGNMAAIVTDGEGAIPVDTIDNVVGDEPVTYIKMDIEGAELEALKGGEQTIRRERPKLAVCVYHKPDDLITLVNYINDLALGYRFYLRHHQYMSWEMVLYALPEAV